MDTIFREADAEAKVESVPLSHLSIELGHLYMEDFAEGPRRLREQFERVAPWVRTAREAMPALPGGRRPRVSTCFLVDDYFTRFSTPAEVFATLVETAGEAGLEIDYIARESGCAEAEGAPLARLVAGRLSAIPVPGANGSRPAALEIGWLSNGERSAADSGEAMRKTRWTPPAEIGARNHSVFVDVELWDDKQERRTWSCAYLASVWQLLRLGMLRESGHGVFRPHPAGAGFPDDWDALPPLVQLNPAAAPFSAYRTFSVLPARFLQIEHAVRVILSQVVPDSAVLKQIDERSLRDGVAVSTDVVDRIDYVFFNDAGRRQE